MDTVHHVTRTPLFAVVWCDFVPLSLPCSSQEEAIDKANAINHRRALINPDIPHEARARPLHIDEDDNLTWLDGEE